MGWWGWLQISRGVHAHDADLAGTSTSACVSGLMAAFGLRGVADLSRSGAWR